MRETMMQDGLFFCSVRAFVPLQHDTLRVMREKCEIDADRRITPKSVADIDAHLAKIGLRLKRGSNGEMPEVDQPMQFEVLADATSTYSREIEQVCDMLLAMLERSGIEHTRCVAVITGEATLLLYVHAATKDEIMGLARLVLDGLEAESELATMERSQLPVWCSCTVNIVTMQTATDEHATACVDGGAA